MRGGESSKICDKEDTRPSLGETPVLSVHDPPSQGERSSQYDSPSKLPWPGVRSRDRNGIAINFADFFEDDPEVLPLRGSRAESAGHVFPSEEPRSNKTSCSPSLHICRSHLLYNTDLFHKKPGTGPCEAGTGTGNAKILAWAATADDVHRGQLGPVQFGDIPHMDHVRETKHIAQRRRQTSRAVTHQR